MTIEEQILNTLKELLSEVREIRRNVQQPANKQILNENDGELKRMKNLRDAFAKFPGEDNGTD